MDQPLRRLRRDPIEHDVTGDLRPDLVAIGDHLTTLINRCFAD